MVIMARARQSRKQWRPKAVIQSAAAQHRSNANHLVSSILQDRQDSNNPEHPDQILRTKSKSKSKTTLTTIAEGHVLNNNNNNNDRNALMLQLSTAVLSAPNLRPSINVTSSSGDALDDDERDDIALFVQQQSQTLNNKSPNNNTTGNNKNNVDHHHVNDPENPIEILPNATPPTDVTADQNCPLKTTTRSSQTENHLPCHYPAKRVKTRLKEETNSDGTSLTTTHLQDNTGKIAKRKAYSRMKKERKATQTLIIVLSEFQTCKRETCLSTRSSRHLERIC